MKILDDISTLLQAGKAEPLKEQVRQALAEGIEAKVILEEGLMVGMNIIGQKFKRNEVYVPEVLIAARAMNGGIEILKPLLAAGDSKARGTVVIGTVQGDLHDIGKNLVKIMMEGKGMEVIDLGTNVSADRYVQAARDNKAQIVACSALLTTTMVQMESVVKALQDAGMRDDVTIMIGGAPVTDEYRKSIGADIYSADAASAADEAARVCAA